jgi:HAD superfamily hydrolase (TIGR01549 family)
MALDFEGHRIEAVLFDVDGTLYTQPRLRMLMMAELAMLPIHSRSIRRTGLVWRVLRQFRKDRERLRSSSDARAPLEQMQYALTAERLGCSMAQVRSIVEEWIDRRPLRHLRSCRRPGLLQFVDHLVAHGVRVGAFSDYPVDEKLKALDVGAACSLRVCATDREVDAFKPSPKGFLRACARWQLPPRAVLYIGDRSDVDGLGARSAGMLCVIIGAAQDEARQGVFGARTFTALQQRLRVV